MRKLPLLLMLAGLVLPAFAAKRVTVDQLEQVLAAAHGKPDTEIAEQLSDMELTERLSAVHFVKLKADLQGDDKAVQALLAVSDPAEFLNLPAAEIPAKPAPDPATQRQIMAQVVNYVTRTVHQLPNFFATRETTRFEDNPHFTETSMPVHFVAKSGMRVSYRDGHEMVVTEAGKVKTEGSDSQGLVSWGEFGPILGTVLLDAAKSKLAWSHWENGASGPEAVFRYAVPSQTSHYSVHFCCVMEESAGQAQAPFNATAGYHGEMAIDPASGAILRLMVEADFEPGSPLNRAGIMVEYGDEEIGGKIFTCPVRSVAISLIHYSHSAIGMQSVLNPDPHKTFLNDVAFVQYHRLGSETRIFASGESGGSADDLGGAGSPVLQPLSAMSTPAPPPETNAPSQPAAATETASAPAVSAATPAQVETAVNTAAASDAPVRSAQTPVSTSEDQTPLFKANAHAVVVDVVVTKGNAEPVRGLGKQAFEVLEDGKPQVVDYFEEHTAATAPDESAPQLPPNMFTNTPAAPESDSVNVVLIDNLNTPFQDQVRVHQQILDFLAKMQPGTRIAVFVLGSKLRLIQTFTSDSAALREALNDKKTGDMPERTAASRSRQDDADDQQTLDTHAVMMGGKQSILGGLTRSSGGAMGDAMGRAAGNQAGERVAMTLQALEYLARYLAGIPGRKNLIWFSTSFPISLFPSAKEQQAHTQSQNYGPAIKEAAGLLTLSKIAVYPVSAEGLQLDNATEASGHMQTTQDALYQQADARAIRTEALNKLAADTGGKAFYNTNDLAAALEHAIDDGAHYYTLVYSPANTHMDGSYRNIEVRTTEGKYDLAYRHGYFADDKVAPEPQAGADPLHPLLVRGMPASTQILLRARVLPLAQQPAPGTGIAGGNAKLSGPLTRYRVDFSVRSTDLDLESAAGGKYTGKIQIGLLAYDRDGNALNWAGGTMALNVGAETYATIQKSGIPAHIEIDLPEKEIYLEAGVYDWSTRKAGTLEIPLHPDMVAADAVKPQ